MDLSLGDGATHIKAETRLPVSANPLCLFGDPIMCYLQSGFTASCKVIAETKA